ncbi:MAG: glycosyltransferase family 2 protein [Candidatus Omnitrophica bacterium]|nr:glycosyltransferase family 2 protein [Candidatus Omnitrophota bacterium]
MFKISVVISTFNRAHLIAQAIESLLVQTFKDYEIIVIDDGSTDATKGALTPYLDKIRYYYQPNQGISSARNLGIQKSRGEIIAFTDDDVSLDPNWLKCIEQCFRDNHCDVVGGRVLPVYPSNTPLWIRNNPTKISGGVVIYDYGDKTVVFDPSHYRFIGANVAFRRQVLNECGGFREDLKYGSRIGMGEDTEIIERLIKKNKILYYCGNALVYHPVDLKRLTLRHAALWNTTLGRFAARQEHENSHQHFIYWFGVPRYLWRGIVIDAFRLCICLFYYPSLYDSCRNFFRKAGMISEYRRMMRKGQVL